MVKNRSSNWIIVAALILASIIAFQAFAPSTAAKKRNLSLVGMGDLRRFEAKQLIPRPGVLASSRSYVGMGDLRRFEAKQLIPRPGESASSRLYVGMGDLRRFEAKQEILFNGEHRSPSP